MGEPRKVQRLGQSSLVVTLPKEWVKRVGLQPGDIVYIEDEGDSLRIKPAAAAHKPQEKKKIKINIKEVEQLGLDLSQVIECLYLLGYDEAHLEPAEPKVASAARKASRMLSGVEALVVGDHVEVRSLIDTSKLDLESIVRNTASLVNEMIELLKQASQRLDVAEEASAIYEEAVRVTHLVNRKLIAETGGKDPLKPAILVAMALSGHFSTILADTLRLSTRMCNGGCSSDIRKINDTVGRLSEAISMVMNALANSKLRLAVEASKMLRNLISEINNALKGCGDANSAAILARLLDAVYTAIAVNGVALCISLQEYLASRAGQD